MPAMRPSIASNVVVTVSPRKTLRSTSRSPPREITTSETRIAGTVAGEASAPASETRIAGTVARLGIHAAGAGRFAEVVDVESPSGVSLDRHGGAVQDDSPDLDPPKRSGQKASFTETRSAVRSAGVCQPGPLRTTTPSAPAPRPEKIWRRIAFASTFRCSADSAAATSRVRTASKDTREGKSRDHRDQEPDDDRQGEKDSTATRNTGNSVNENDRQRTEKIHLTFGATPEARIQEILEQLRHRVDERLAARFGEIRRGARFGGVPVRQCEDAFVQRPVGEKVLKGQLPGACRPRR